MIVSMVSDVQSGQLIILDKLTEQERERERERDRRAIEMERYVSINIDSFLCVI